MLKISAKRVSNAVSAMAAVLSFGLLFGAIEALHREPDHAKRLGYLAGFILAFAFVVSLFTGAKRTDIFAVTAAYAAVLIVYIGGKDDPKNATGV